MKGFLLYLYTMKKQTLNEQVSRMRDMMGCCKGKLNEAVQAGSQQEAQMVNAAVAEIESLGLENEDLEVKHNPELDSVKQKLANEFLNPFLQTATKEDLKQAIIEVLKFRKQINTSEQPNAQAQQNVPVQANEQASVTIMPGTAAYKALSPLNAAMKGVADVLSPINIYMVATWFLFAFFKCYIYALSNYENTIFNKIVAFLALDLKNIFTRDPWIKGCGRGGVD